MLHPLHFSCAASAEQQGAAQVPSDQQSLPECSGDLKDSAFRLLVVLAAQDAHSTSPAVLRCHTCREEPQVPLSTTWAMLPLLMIVAAALEEQVNSAFE